MGVSVSVVVEQEQSLATYGLLGNGVMVYVLHECSVEDKEFDALYVQSRLAKAAIGRATPPKYGSCGWLLRGTIWRVASPSRRQTSPIRVNGASNTLIKGERVHNELKKGEVQHVRPDPTD